jgi:hypothetical protein
MQNRNEEEGIRGKRSDGDSPAMIIFILFVNVKLKTDRKAYLC